MEGKTQFKLKPREENLALIAGLRLVCTVMEEFCAGHSAYLTQQQKMKQCEQLKTHLVPGILDLIHGDFRVLILVLILGNLPVHTIWVGTI